MTRLLMGWVIGICLAASTAFAAEGKLSVGLYVPDIAGVDRAARIDAIQSLASYLADTTGLEVVGRNYSRLSDLLTTDTEQQVDLVVAPASLFASKGWTPFATLVQGGAKEAPWLILATGDAKTVSDLEDREVIMPTVSQAGRRGKADQDFVTGVLLEGEIGATYFKWLSAPDAGSAMQAVSLGKAQAAIVAQGSDTGGLRTIFTSRPIPLHGIVAVRAVPQQTLDMVQQALVRWKGKWMIFDGWSAGAGNGYAVLRSRSSQKRPPLFSPDVVMLKDREVISTEKYAPELSAPLTLFRVPTERPDQSS